jgi:hypothetical protein
MVLFDEGKQDIAGFLASRTHLAVVPRQDEGRMEMQHPARKRLSTGDVHLVVKRHLTALGEDGTSQ